MLEAENRGIVDKCVTPIVKVSGYISAFFLFCLMTLIFSDVFLRYFFNSPLLGGTELVEFLMAVTICFSLGYGQHLKRHVNVEIFYQKLEGRPKAVVDIVIHLLCIGIFILIAYCGLTQAVYLKDANMTSQVLLIPVWPFRVVLSAGAFIYCLAVFKDLVDCFKVLFPK